MNIVGLVRLVRPELLTGEQENKSHTKHYHYICTVEK